MMVPVKEHKAMPSTKKIIKESFKEIKGIKTSVVALLIALEMQFQVERHSNILKITIDKPYIYLYSTSLIGNNRMDGYKKIQMIGKNLSGNCHVNQTSETKTTLAGIIHSLVGSRPKLHSPHTPIIHHHNALTYLSTSSTI